MSFYFPTEVAGQGIRIGIGDYDHNGKIDFDFGLQGFNAWGNGASGGYNSTEIGYGTARGAYIENSNGSYTPWARQDNHWGADSWGSHGSSTYQDVFGNYENHRYANDVFGNYSYGDTHATPWSFSDRNASGNSYWGNHQESGRYADAFGNWGSYNVPGCVPNYGCRDYCCGGGVQVNAWFGGCFG